jgi:hypothetical protein
LVLIVDDLRMRQEGLTKETTKLEQTIAMQNETKRRFKDDLYSTVVQNSNNNLKELKKGVIRLYRAWVLEEKQFNRGQTDPLNKYANERKQLENSVKTLEDKLNKDTRKHSESNKRVLKENVLLIKEINMLKLEKHKLEITKKEYSEANMKFKDDILMR